MLEDTLGDVLIDLQHIKTNKRNFEIFLKLILSRFIMLVVISQTSSLFPLRGV